MEPDYTTACSVVTVQANQTGQFRWACEPHAIKSDELTMGQLLKEIVEHCFNAGTVGAMISMINDLKSNAAMLVRNGDKTTASVLHQMATEMIEMLSDDNA